jgi:hypothetical protein
MVLGLTLTVVACAALFDGTALAWSPEPATYGSSSNRTCR